MTCPKCSGMVRLDGYDEDLAAVCMNCGARTYAPFQPHVMSTARLAQATYCKNCGIEPAMAGKSIGSQCLGVAILNGRNTAQKQRERRVG